MLREDEREERSLERVRLPAEKTVAVFATVRVVRRKNDKPAVGEPGREVVIVAMIPLDHVFRHGAAAVLADDHRPLLAGFHVLGQQQNSPGEHIGKYVQHHFVAHPFRLVVHLPRPGPGREHWIVEPAQKLVPKVVSVLAGLQLEFFQSREVRRRVRQEESVPVLIAIAQQPLDVAFQLLDLKHLPAAGIKTLPPIHRGPGG